MKSLVLFSGGMDSTTLLYEVMAKGHHVHTLTIDYRQRNSAEILAAKKIATEILRVRSHTKLVFDLHQIGGSPLVASGLPIPKDRTVDQITNGNLSPLYVPARNTIFLSLALAWSQTMGAEEIYVAATKEDQAGFPDCRPDFFEAFEWVASQGVPRPPRILAPYVDTSKAEVVKRGLELDVPYELTVSCYEQQAPAGVACGACDACVLRAAAFTANGVHAPAVPVV